MYIKYIQPSATEPRGLTLSGVQIQIQAGVIILYTSMYPPHSGAIGLPNY